MQRIFRFVWRDGRLPDLPIEWAELTDELGMPDAETLIAPPEVKDALRRNTDEAIARGVFGVPTLAIGDELFWGADATAMAADFVAAGCRFDDPEYARVARCRWARRAATRWASRGAAVDARRRAATALQRVRARNAEVALDRARDVERVLVRRREAGHVAHLAAAPRLGLAVQMQLRLRMPQHRRPIGLARDIAVGPRTRCRPAG